MKSSWDFGEETTVVCFLFWNSGLRTRGWGCSYSGAVLSSWPVKSGQSLGQRQLLKSGRGFLWWMRAGTLCVSCLSFSVIPESRRSILQLRLKWLNWFQLLPTTGKAGFVVRVLPSKTKTSLLHGGVTQNTEHPQNNILKGRDQHETNLEIPGCWNCQSKSLKQLL